ncbi:helix-turn-helix domain-containing protein [Lentibacillus sediminis]|uniref:helix-turn-helix domain-containing protein n=1 Tax=Lentibacillus sediminis TaxID=1940529 RepID=UPI000C1C7E58|nr:helix-turn-helix transcriptional regulator [Lentibacillus sediminis]
MKWSAYKETVNVLDENEIEELELIAVLIARRKQMELTQWDLAKLTNLNQSTIARLEREGVAPKLDTLKKVVHALGLRLALVEENGEIVK